MRLLSQGCTGPDVLRVQRMLNRAAPKGALLKEDSIFGPKTKARVIEFQKQYKLTVDGIVGEITGSLLARSHVLEDQRIKDIEATAAWSRTVALDRDY